MAEAVRDRLEAVEVHQEDREALVRVLARALEQAFQPAQEERAVGQVGQRVVERGAAELLLGLPARGDVEGDADRAAQVAGGIAQGLEVRLEVPPAPFELELHRLAGQGPPVRAGQEVVGGIHLEVFGQARVGQGVGKQAQPAQAAAQGGDDPQPEVRGPDDRGQLLHQQAQPRIALAAQPKLPVQ